MVHVNTIRLFGLGLVLASGVGQHAWATQQKEEDSVYQWGRWAVLSPAAGGESYIAALTPDAANNARPGDADEFQPEVDSLGTPPELPPVDIAGFCEAGTACGYATYSNSPPDSDSMQPAAVPEGFDLSSEENPDGPVLARFELETFPTDGGESARFKVSDTGSEEFPDIQSVDMEGAGSLSGEKRTRTAERREDGSQAVSLTTQVSTLEKLNDFDEVDTGSWSDKTDTRTRVNSGGPPTLEFDFSSSNGFFVFGKTATIEQMEAFTAGNVTAVYRGVVVDYGSAVTMEFDLGERTVRGEFASENGFNGFQADGRVDGINFAGSNGDQKFTGSFFNKAENVSGAVNNGIQLGVYSADHVHPDLP